MAQPDSRFMCNQTEPKLLLCQATEVSCMLVNISVILALVVLIKGFAVFQLPVQCQKLPTGANYHAHNACSGEQKNS